MKILVYYLGVQNITGPKAVEVRDETIKKLEEKFPSLKNQMIVILQRGSDSDRMEVLDMSPQYYPQPSATAYQAPYKVGPTTSIGSAVDYSGPY